MMSACVHRAKPRTSIGLLSHGLGGYKEPVKHRLFDEVGFP